MSEEITPYPAVDDPAQLPEGAPVGAIAPVSTPESVWIKRADGWVPTTPFIVDDFEDLRDDFPEGTRVVVRAMPHINSYYVKVADGWAIDGEAERAYNWPPERRIEWKLDLILELLEKEQSE